MSEHTQQPKEKLVADLKVVIADAEELLAQTASHTGEQLTALRERMQNNLRHARHRLGDLEDAVRERANRLAKDTDHYVHEHPWKAIGVATGVGLLIGMLISRR